MGIDNVNWNDPNLYKNVNWNDPNLYKNVDWNKVNYGNNQAPAQAAPPVSTAAPAPAGTTSNVATDSGLNASAGVVAPLSSHSLAQVLPSSTGGPGAVDSAQTKPDNALDVTQFGAVGDGHTDNTQAIQKAMDAAKASGQTVWIPAGTFNHSGPIKADGVHIEGSGSGTVLNATSPKNAAITLTGDGVSLSNVATTVSASERSSQPEDAAVLVTNARNANVSNVSVQGAASNGIRLDNVQNSKISACSVNGSNADGICLVNGSSNNLIQKCQVVNASDDSYSDNYYTDPARNPTGVQDSGNTFDSCYAGPNYHQGRSFALMGSKNDTVKNCVSDGSLWHGMVVGGDSTSETAAGGGATLSNNLVINNASGLPISVTSDGGHTENASLASVSGTQTSGNAASVLGWTPVTNLPKPNEFNSYTGGGAGSNNSAGKQS